MKVLVVWHYLKNLVLNKSTRQGRRRFYTGANSKRTQQAAQTINASKSMLPWQQMLIAAFVMLVSISILIGGYIMLPNSGVLPYAIAAMLLIAVALILKRIWNIFPSIKNAQLQYPRRRKGIWAFIFLILLSIAVVMILAMMWSPMEPSTPKTVVNIWIILGMIAFCVLGVIALIVFLVIWSSKLAPTGTTAASNPQQAQGNKWAWWTAVKSSYHTKHLSRAAIYLFCINILLMFGAGQRYFSFVFAHPRWFLFFNFIAFFFLVTMIYKSGPETKFARIAVVIIFVYFFLDFLGFTFPKIGPGMFENRSVSARTTGNLEGDSAAAARYVEAMYAKTGGLTEDVKWCRDNYFPDAPVMWTVAMAESSGRQFTDAARTIPSHNPKYGSTATGLLQIVDNTSYEIGKHVNPSKAATKEQWLAEGEPGSEYDRKTLEGNCKSGRWLYDNHGVGDWLASQGKWNEVAKIQFGGRNFELARSEGGSFFGGSPATIAPNGIHSVQLTAPPAPKRTEFIRIQDLFPAPYTTCGVFTQLDDGPAVNVIVEPGAGAGDRYNQPVPLGNLPFVKRLALQSPTDKPIRVIYRYMAYKAEPGEDLNSACTEAFSR